MRVEFFFYFQSIGVYPFKVRIMRRVEIEEEKLNSPPPTTQEKKSFKDLFRKIILGGPSANFRFREREKKKIIFEKGEGVVKLKLRLERALIPLKV